MDNNELDNENTAETADKKQRAPKKEKAPDGKGGGSGKAIKICVLICAVLVVIGIIVAAVLYFTGKSDEDEVIPDERTEEIDGSDSEHTKLY